MDNNFEEITRKILTLCLILKDDQILLGMKKRGFGQGRWNGFGGKVDEGEMIEEAAIREVKEECGLIAKNMRNVGQIDFKFHNNPGEILEVHIYRCEDYEGEPMESEEMSPQWFDISNIPYGKMWPDDIYWLPLLIEKKCFSGSFLFGDDDVILHQEISAVESLSSVGSLNDL